MSRKLTYKQMQESLPDYVFGRMGDDDKEAFERGITDYPDIQEEIESVRKVFNKVEQIDFNRKFEQGSRNLSVGVQKRLESKYQRGFLFNFSPRLIMSTMGILAITLILYYTGSDSGEADEITNELASIDYETVIEAANPYVIPDDISGEADIFPTADEINSLVEDDYDILDEEDEDISELIEELIASNSDGSDQDLVDDIMDYGIEPMGMMAEQLELMDENEFQNILEVIENEDIKS